MSRLFALSLAGVLASAAGSARADVPPPPSRAARWEGGIGVGLGGSRVANDIVGATDLYFPLQLGDSLRLEPALGYSTTSQDLGGTSFKTKRASTSLRGGAGAFYSWALDVQTFGYVGLRGQVIHDRTAFDYETTAEATDPSLEAPPATTTTRTDLGLALAFGGEGLLTRSFSLGVEGRFGYTHFGETDVEGDSANGLGALAGLTSSAPGSGSGLRTEAFFFARLYFWQLR